MRVVALLLAASLAGALAACPNQCSGHGRCTAYDRCECFSQTGTTWQQRVGWTGPDCSQRTCPLGRSFDELSTKTEDDRVGAIRFYRGKRFDGKKNTDSIPVLNSVVRNYELPQSDSFQVRVVKAVNSKSLQYQWKLVSQSSYSAAVEVVDNSGNRVGCTSFEPCELKDNGKLPGGKLNTGVFIYFPDTLSYGPGNEIEEGNIYEFTVQYFYDSLYSSVFPNTAHQYVECSGRGKCDSATGRCDCFLGYTGESCQRTLCPNECSGHGMCQSLSRFATDGSKTYNGYDAVKEMGCLCDDGFRGPDCSQVECPSGDDPMGGYGGDGLNSADEQGPAMDCSGRGLCDYSTGLCSCFKGYFGERCEHQTNFV